MSALGRIATPAEANPIDLVEEMASANDWPFNRNSDHDLLIEVEGRWTDYRLYFSWSEELTAMHYSCAFDMKAPKTRQGAIFELLAMINERLWVGHFDIGSEDHMVLYRHTALLRGLGGLSAEQLEDLVDTSLSECERFYPAFQFVLWGGKSASESIAASLLETVGEA